MIRTVGRVVTEHVDTDLHRSTVEWLGSLAVAAGRRQRDVLARPGLAKVGLGDTDHEKIVRLVNHLNIGTESVPYALGLDWGCLLIIGHACLIVETAADGVIAEHAASARSSRKNDA